MQSLSVCMLTRCPIKHESRGMRSLNCFGTRVISVADSDADIFELFARGRQHPHAANFLVRANRGRQRRVVAGANQLLLWDHRQTLPVVAEQILKIPGKGGRKASVATLPVRHTPVVLGNPQKGIAV